jgi:hypothetical protein
VSAGNLVSATAHEIFKGHLQWQSLLSKMLAIPEALKSSLLPLCGAMQIVVSLNIAM